MSADSCNSSVNETENITLTETLSPQQKSKHHKKQLEHYDFDSMSLNDIYDCFLDSSNKMGLLANYILKYLTTVKGVQESGFCDKISRLLAKNKEEQKRQRELFVDLQRLGGLVLVGEIRNECKCYLDPNRRKSKRNKHNSSESSSEQQQFKNDSILARIAHLAVENGGRDGDTLTTMMAIYGDKDRETMDDKNTRNSALWERVAEYFNSEDWSLMMNDHINDPRVGIEFIDPNILPESELSSTDVRTKFKYLLNLYTTLWDRFHRSGQHAAGAPSNGEQIDGDDDLYENFFSLPPFNESHRHLMLYVHLLWQREPPQWCNRLMPENAQCEVGLTCMSLDHQTSAESDHSSSSSSNNKLVESNSVVTSFNNQSAASAFESSSSGGTHSSFSPLSKASSVHYDSGSSSSHSNSIVISGNQCHFTVDLTEEEKDGIKVQIDKDKSIKSYFDAEMAKSHTQSAIEKANHALKMSKEESFSEAQRQEFREYAKQLNDTIFEEI